MTTYSELKDAFRAEADPTDWWGSAIDWLFDVCSYLYERGYLNVPGHVQYHPGAFGPEPLPEDREALFDSANIGDVERLGFLLAALEQRERDAGNSY